MGSTKITDEQLVLAASWLPRARPMSPGPGAGECSTCGAPVLWVRMMSGRAQPLDPEPVDGGNVELVEGGRVRVVKPELGVARYRSHFAGCAHAELHRRHRGGGR